MTPLSRSPHDREIVRLGLPALGALAADPLVSLVDTAFVGRLGSDALAALAVAAALFGIAFSLFNFLAYGTTPLVAGAAARGETDEAARFAAAAALIGIPLGVAAAVVLITSASPLLRLMGADGSIQAGARSYLTIRALALPAVMLVTVGHGVYRGLQDTRTPLKVTLGLNLVNLVLDPIFIFGFGWDLAGAAWATVAAQWMGAAWFALLLAGPSSSLGVLASRPRRSNLRVLFGAGRALVLRTGALLAVLTLATAVAARVGTVQVAAHQVVLQLWVFLALVLDALAIAAQAMIGRMLPVDVAEAGRISRRLLWLGLWVGVTVSVLLAVLYPWMPGWFTTDQAVVASVRRIYPFLVVMQPLNAVVFVWDGILIGATDFAYLAWTMLASASVASAALLAVGPIGWGLAGVWWSLAALMAARAVAAAWWQLRGPFAFARGPSPSSRGA